MGKNRKRCSWRVNEGVHATPSSTIIDNHYAQLGIFEMWEPDRVIRLSKFMNMTLYELASMVAIPHNQMTQYMKLGFPSSACLLLSLVEYVFVKGNMVDSPPFDTEGLFPTHKL